MSPKQGPRVWMKGGRDVAQSEPVSGTRTVGALASRPSAREAMFVEITILSLCLVGCGKPSGTVSRPSTSTGFRPAPNSGFIYLTHIAKYGSGDSDTLIRLRPDGTEAGTVSIRPTAQDLAVAPAGTPNAGTVYIVNAGTTSAMGALSVVGPDASVASVIPIGTTTLGALAIAPAGTPKAGTIYLANFSSPGAPGHTVSVIGPGATTASAIDVGIRPDALAIAPAGTPNAGTVYVSNEGTATSLGVPYRN